MAQMIRKQIYIDADSDRFLKQRARELGITEAEVVRRALRDAEQLNESATRTKALEDLVAYIREHRMRDVPAGGWTFSREDLYDEMYEERFEGPKRRSEGAKAPSRETSTT